MEEGKSQTWFYYASMQAELYGIEYVMKVDTDSLLYLDRYFEFAHWGLPPSPYHEGIIAGQPVSKNKWKPEKLSPEKERHFGKYYGGTHTYVAGQLYILSRDVAAGVARIASSGSAKTYLEYFEDHDISLMAFMNQVADGEDHPMRFIMIQSHRPFWNHPVKIKHGVNKWKRFWTAEMKRIQQIVWNERQQQQLVGGGVTTVTDQSRTTGVSSYSSKTSSQARGIFDFFTYEKSITNVQKIPTKTTMEDEDHAKAVDEDPTPSNDPSAEDKEEGVVRTRASWIHQLNKILTPDYSTNIRLVQESAFEWIQNAEIDNTINDGKSKDDACYFTTSDEKSSLRPIKIVQFNGDTEMAAGISHESNFRFLWYEFAKLLESKREFINPDIIILNGIKEILTVQGDYDEDADAMTIQKLALDLSMNYMWGVHDISLLPRSLVAKSGDNSNKNGNNQTETQQTNSAWQVTLHGSAILSKCKLFDPFMVRGDEPILQDQHSTGSGGGALFARTASRRSDLITGSNHINIGSVYQLEPSANQTTRIREYLGTNESKVIRSIVAGEMNATVCTQSAVPLVNLPRSRNTWPTECLANNKLGGSFGSVARDRVCTNMIERPIYKNYFHLPCYQHTNYNDQGPSLVSLSRHSIISYVLR